MTAEPIRHQSPIPLIDLQRQREALEPELNEALGRVLDHGGYIMGPEVAQLESSLAEWTGASVISCSSGTDALIMILLALGVRPGDGVVVPTFTFAATAEAVAVLGAIPIFVDVCGDTFTMRSEDLQSGISVARAEGIRPTAAIAVDLFGHPADYPALQEVCDREHIHLVADAAQSFGARLNGQPVGRLARSTATSFFPAKPLGCYGDGGAVFTVDEGVSAACQSVRVHGQGTHKYENVRVGLNARLDTLQAAVLLQKLRRFDWEFERRQHFAERYTAALRDVGERCRVPTVRAGVTSAWAQYTLLVHSRDDVRAALTEDGIASAVYYPVPLHRQPAYREFPRATEELSVSDDLALRVLSVPVHPYLIEVEQDRVIEALRRALT